MKLYQILPRSNQFLTATLRKWESIFTTNITRSKTKMFVRRNNVKYESPSSSGCKVKVYVIVFRLHIYIFVLSRAFMAGAASQAGDADSSRAPGLTSSLQGSMNVHRGALLLVPQ